MNLTHSFWKWFRDKSVSRMDGKNALEELREKGEINELVTVMDGKWKWKDGGKLGYKKAWIASIISRLVDVEVAHDCIQRVCCSSWWK